MTLTRWSTLWTANTARCHCDSTCSLQRQLSVCFGEEENRILLGLHLHLRLVLSVTLKQLSSKCTEQSLVNCWCETFTSQIYEPISMLFGWFVDGNLKYNCKLILLTLFNINYILLRYTYLGYISASFSWTWRSIKMSTTNDVGLLLSGKTKFNKTLKKMIEINSIPLLELFRFHCGGKISSC